MASAALQSFRRRVTIDFPARAREAAQKRLVQVARQGHARIMAEQTARSGIAPDWDAYANTPGNPNLDSVVLPGPIVFRYRYHREIIVAALDMLRQASPVQSGKYRNSHTLFIDFQAVKAIPERLVAGQDVMISNPVPYARRLEVGKRTDGRPFVFQVDPHIYERVAYDLKAKFGRVARIEFTYADLPGAWVIKGRLPQRYWTTRAARTASGRKAVFRKRYQKAGSKVRAPAIVISALPST
jgi:hypothetical protein